MNKPYGGKLINRYTKLRNKSIIGNMPDIRISPVNLSDLYNIADGAFSPLEAFMDSEEFKSVVFKKRYHGLPWTIPILLDVDEEDIRRIGRKRKVVLRSLDNEKAGWINIREIYKHDKGMHAEMVFGTKDRNHPGVNYIYQMKKFLIGGEVRVFKPTNKESNYLTPAETREIFIERGYKTIAGFQTRNVLHRAHEYLQRCALEYVDGLFVQPIVGWKKEGDFKAEIVLHAYKEFIKDYYPKKRVVLGSLRTAMRYAGPKEALFHAIIRKNFGCSHFIIGRDHAGVGNYYEKYAAHDIFEEVGNIGIEILKFKEPLYCNRCKLIVTEKTCGHNKKYHQEISGSLVRRIIKSGHQPKNEIFRPEIFRIIEKEYKLNNLFY